MQGEPPNPLTGFVLHSAAEPPGLHLRSGEPGHPDPSTSLYRREISKGSAINTRLPVSRGGFHPGAWGGENSDFCSLAKGWKAITESASRMNFILTHDVMT